MSGFDHGEDPGFQGIGKYVPGGDDGCQLGIMRSLPRAICAGFCAAFAALGRFPLENGG